MNLKSKIKQLPGTLVYTGVHEKETTLKHIKYSPKSFDVYNELQTLEEDVVDWIVLEGLTNVGLVKDICNSYNVDALVIEDILHVNQRTKVEVHDDYIFFVIRYSYLRDEKISHDYISMLLLKNTIITFSESQNLFIEDVIHRLENTESQIRTRQHDYLFYVLYDMIVDESTEVFNYIENALIEIEEYILELTPNDQVKLYNLRKELVFLRSLTIQLLQNTTTELFSMDRFFNKNTKKFYDDVYDHVMNLNSRATNLIENTKHILDVYMNNMSNKMNQIMTTLTIFSAIFIPLSFFAGVFGMNFVNFSFLNNEFGMLYFTLICLLIPIMMLIYFKVRKWF